MNTNNKLVQQNYLRSKGGVGPEASLYQKIQKQKVIPQNVINNYQQKKDLMSPRSDKNQNKSDVRASEVTAEHGIASIEPVNKIKNLDQRSVKNKNQIDQKFVRNLNTKQIIKNSFNGNNTYLAFKNQLSDSIKTDKNNATVDRESHAADFSMTDTTGFQQIQHSTIKTHTKHTKSKALYRSPNEMHRKLMSQNNLAQKLNSTNQIQGKKNRLARVNSQAHQQLESMNLLNNLTKATLPERENSRSSDNIPVEKFDKTARKLRNVGKQESRVTLDQMNQKTPFTSRRSPKGVVQQQKEELQVDPEAESLQKTKVKTVAHNQKTHRISQLLEEQSDKQFQHAIPAQLIQKKTNQKDKHQKSSQDAETFMGFKINLLNEASNHKLRLPKKLVNKTMSSDPPQLTTDSKNVEIQRLILNPSQNFSVEDARLKTARDEASTSKRAQRSLFESAKQELRKIQNFKKESQYIDQKFMESPTIQPQGVNTVNSMSTNLRTKYQPSDKKKKQEKVSDFNPYHQQPPSDKKSQVRMRSQELQKSTVQAEVFDNNYENFSADDEEHSFVGVVADDQAVAQVSGQVGEFSSMTKMRPKKSPRKSRQIRNSIPKIQDSFHKISLKHSFDGSSVKDRSRCMSSSQISDLEQNDNPRESNDSQPRLSNQSYNSAQRENLRVKKKGKTVLEYSQLVNKVETKHQSAVQILGHESIRTSQGFDRQQSEILNEDGISQKMGEITTRGLGTTKKEQKKVAIDTCIPEKKLNLRLSNLRVLSNRNFSNGQSLTHIDVRNNRLQQLPDQLCECSFLRELRLDYNFLQTLPNGINQLQNMTILSASQNNLKVIPYNLLSLKGNLEQLILNDNKIQQIQSKIGNLVNLNRLLLHNNQIVDIPSSMYKLKNLKQLSLDWFSYLYSDQFTVQTKILKGFEANEKYKDAEEIEEAHQHQKVINDLLDLCKIVQIVELKKYFEETQQIFHENPQQDDCEPKQQNHLMTRGVTKKKKIADNHDPLINQKSVRIQFIKFLLYFNGLTYIDQLIMKSIHPNKQRRLSHLIALQGNLYLLKDILKQIDIYHHNCLCQNSALGQDLMNISSQNALRILQTKYQFLNSIDRDFSTPIILALKNKKNLIVKELMDHPKTCLKQSSMKYGTALHVSLGNDEFKLSYKILRMLKNQKDFNPEQDFNKIDEDGNSLLHILFRNFNQDVENASKISLNLIRRGCNLKYKNKIKHTPLHQAYYYLQNDAIKFALHHNWQIRRNKDEQKYPMFDFNEQGGKLNFTSLHYAVYQNNFQLLFMLLRSREYLDHTIKDSAGRRAIDLCNSISAVFKALRRELQKQGIRAVRHNVQTTEEQEAKFQPVHKILLNKMKLTHYHINKLEIKRKNEGLKRINSQNQISFATRHQSVKPSIQQSYFTTIDAKNSMPRQSEKHLRKGKVNDPLNEEASLTPMTLPGAFSKRVSTNHQLETKRKLYYQKSEYMIKKTSINMSESLQKTQMNKKQQERTHNTSINSINQIQESRAFQKRMSQNSNYFPPSAKPTGSTNSFIKKKRSVEVHNDLNNLTYDQSFKYQQDLEKSVSQTIIDLKSVNQIIAEQSTQDGPPSRSGFQYPHSRQHGIDNQFSNIELTLENMDDESGSEQGVFYPLEDSDSSLSDMAAGPNSNRDSKRYGSDLHGENVSDDDANEQAYGQSPQTGQRASLKAFSSQFESSKLFQKNSFNEQKNQGKPNGVDMLMRAESHIGYNAPEFQMQDFQDSEQLVKYLLKIHQIQSKSNELYLLERINDSLEGKIFPQQSTTIKPPVSIDQKQAKLQDLCDDLELSDEDHTPTLLSNRKNIGGTTMIQKSFKEIDKPETKKQNITMAVPGTDFEENSIGIEEIDNTESHIEPGVIARKQSTTSQLSISTFGKKRQSYLNHEQNDYNRGKNMSNISGVIMRSNQTSRNQLQEKERTNTVTSYRSDMSFNSDADQQVQNPNISKNANKILTQRSMNMIIIDESQQNVAPSNKQSTASSTLLNQQSTALKKIEIMLIEYRNTHDLSNQMRVDFRTYVDQLNTEVHRITLKKDLQDYLKQLQALINNVKRMEHKYFKTICMELENVAGVVNLKVQRPEKKSIITTKKPSLGNFNQIKKLDLSKITNLKDQIFQNNTQRLTMQKRPQLLQTSKPAQGSAYKAIGDDNKSVETLAITKVKSVKDFDEELTNKINKFIDESKVDESIQQSQKNKKADSYITSSNVTIKDSRIHTAQKDNDKKRTRSSKTKVVQMSQTQSMKIMKTIQNANINRLKNN